MSFIEEEVSRASKYLGINLKKLSPFEFDLKRNRLENIFCNKAKSSLFMWERLNNFKSFKDVNGWRLISKILDKGSVVMFFNKEDEDCAFLFNCVKDVVSVLSESIGFEFYLTDNNLNYILCFNHHDYLIASGSILERFEKMVY